MKRRKKGNRPVLPVRDMPAAELFAIVDRAQHEPLTDDERALLKAVIETLYMMTEEVAAKNASMLRLKCILFGATTEKTGEVLGDGGEKPTTNLTKKPEKRQGHGRNGAAAYVGASRVKMPHAEIKHGDSCPDCGHGRVYEQAKPAELIRIVGMAPMNATVYECERLRCNGCGKVFTASAPAGVGEKKYDESVAAMIAMFKYGCGVPFHRLEKFQAGLGVPLPAGTQWDLIEAAVEQVEPAFEELVRQAAQGDVLHNDDTAMKILGFDVDVLTETRVEAKTRTGIFTSGIIAKAKERVMALFFTGHNHAGENLAAVLARREADLTSPIQMCDALSRNTKGDFKTILGNCLAHARRKFVEVVENFPEECRRVLETLRDVYHNDEVAREEKLSPEARLLLHQEKSEPLMKDLEAWLREQVEERKVEPNSTLGEAITYMQNHWAELTLFLRQPGAPLDNNICERALKKAILHRKNALFYKTENGARVGDMFMSLIHTAELNKANPFDYLIALQRHSTSVKSQPADWLPWNYRAALAAIASGPGPPG